MQEAIEKDGKELRFLDEYSFLYKNMEPGEIVSGLNNSDKILGYVEKFLRGQVYRYWIIELTLWNMAKKE